MAASLPEPRPTGDASGALAKRRIDRGGWLITALVFGLVLLQAATVAVRAKAISPFDEAAHFDYVVQLQHGNFPVPAGQRYSEEAVQNWACRPTDRAASLAEVCGVAGSPSDPRVLFGGINYEARYGPIYYGLAALGSTILRGAGVENFTAARLVSGLLYALGTALLVLVALRIAVSSIAAGGVILAASATGLSLSVGATVGPDAMAFLGTAAVIASALLSPTWRSAVVSTILVAAVAGLAKPNFIVMAILGSSLLLLRWTWVERRFATDVTQSSLVRLGIGLALPVVASAAASAGWAALAVARSQTDAPPDGGINLVLQSSLDPAARVAEHLWAILRPDGGTVPGPAFTMLDTPLLGVAGLVVAIATMGACLGAWLWPAGESRSVLLLRAVAVAVPLSAVTLTAIFWMTVDGGHATASRYGLPLFAAASVGLGASVTRRPALAVAIFGVTAWLVAWIGIFGSG